MSVLQVSKALAYGTCGGLGLMAVAAAKPKTERAEKARNSIYTAADMGVLAATPFITKKVVSKNPQVADKVALKTGKTIEKVLKYLSESIPKVLKRLEAIKEGKKVIELCKTAGLQVVAFVKGSKVLSKVAQKVVVLLEKFAKAPAATKGKYGLIAGGVLLLTHLALKTIKNHYRKDGAIEQKYADLKKA